MDCMWQKEANSTVEESYVINCVCCDQLCLLLCLPSLFVFLTLLSVLYVVQYSFVSDNNSLQQDASSSVSWTS